MATLKKHLFLLLSGEKINHCCLCLNKFQDYFSINDLITLEETSKQIEIYNILSYVIGVECAQNLTTKIICRDCLEILLKCYKFIKTCKERAKYFSNVIAVLGTFLNDTVPEIDNYKTIYLTINEDTLVGTQYNDHKTVIDNNEALKRLKIISNPVHKDHFHDIFDSTDLWAKDKKRKGNKHKGDLIDKIPINKILFDEDNLGLYKCKMCHRIFPRLHNLKRHFIRVHAPKDFPCSKCNKSFGSPAILEEHRLESHSGKKAICIECGKKYCNTKSLKLHELSHKLILNCGTCGKFFNRQRNYEKHVISKRCQLVQPRKYIEKKFICDYCNKKYACKGTLRVHIQFEHGNGCHHICSWCGKKFCSLSKLKAHSVTHTQEKNFSCEICGGCYVTKESLLYHTRTHTGEKPYECEHCDQRFLSSSRRAEHIRRHHMEPMLECDVCHTKFRGRSCLLRHKKRHFDPNSRLHYTKLAENEV